MATLIDIERRKPIGFQHEETIVVFLRESEDEGEEDRTYKGDV